MTYSASDLARSAGARFRQALAEEHPLQVVGTINANHALLAKRAGYRAIYLSGGGVAAGSLGLPDLGISSLDDVLTDIRRITDVCDTPLLVDVDTGFGASAFNVARTTKEAGADAIFPEAMTDLAMYRKFVDAVKVPVLANITEFGATPLFTTEELGSTGVSMVLYPLSAFRAMNKAAENVYAAIRRDGTQKNVVDTMQTRSELYESIGYHDFEQKLDALFAQGKGK
ncbi:2-methylisocitrate lyase [compost metagenome]